MRQAWLSQPPKFGTPSRTTLIEVLQIVVTGA
jgi:hypothetical protein